MATPPVKPRNTGLKIISVVLAILLWLYVMNQGQLSTRQSVLEVDLDYIHLAEGLTVEGLTRFRCACGGYFRNQVMLRPMWICPVWEKAPIMYLCMLNR